MSIGACEVCATEAGGATDRSRARPCLGCDTLHVVCVACVSRFGLAARVPKWLRECPDGARVMHELMGAESKWVRKLRESDEMGPDWLWAMEHMRKSGKPVPPADSGMGLR